MNSVIDPQILMGLILVCIALTVVTVILSVVVFLNWRSLTGLKKRYAAFMLRENSEGITIERLIDECIYETNSLGEAHLVLKQRVSDIEERVPRCFQKIGIVRYNPFEDTGGDLSYAIALLDEGNSGFILNGIYSRSGSTTYAKEIEQGVSTRHKLSPEEKEALQMAVACPHRYYPEAD